MHQIRALVVIAAALLAGAAAVPAASAAPVSAASAAVPVDYVALGDSYSSGTGIGSYDPGSGDCLRSGKAYPALWAGSHAVRSFSHVACSGADTQEIRARQLGTLGDETDLVTITAGGNDAGFSDTIRACIFPASDSQCDNAVRKGETFARDRLPARLDGLYEAIKARSPHAQVVVVGYPRLFELGTCPFSFSQYKRRRLNEGADVLDRVIAERAKGAGLAFADARPRFSGHGVCAQEPWINQLDLGRPVESYHPDTTGHARGYLPTLTAVTG